MIARHLPIAPANFGSIATSQRRHAASLDLVPKAVCVVLVFQLVLRVPRYQAGRKSSEDLFQSIEDGVSD